MYIKNIRLKNFARVYTGLNKTEITIDFTRNVNRINLLAGVNGSGKTSIMSCFHVYAYNSSMDNRDNIDLIMEDRSGEKEIVLVDGENEYCILHIYKRNSSTGTLSVKSFISKNDEDLNVQGNTTSFKTIVYEELGLDETFLSLMALGNNIAGFIGMTTGERKTFSSKLFNELEIFSMYYKKVNMDVRELKTLLGNISEKLTKYKDVNPEELETFISQLRNKLKSIEDQITNNSINIGSVNSQILAKSDIINKIESKKARVSEILDTVSMYNAKKKLNVSDMESLLQELNSMKRSLSEKMTNKAVVETKLTTNINLVNGKLENRKNLQNNLNNMTSDARYDDLIRLRSTLELEISNLENDNNNVELLSITKEQLLEAKIYLDGLMDKCGDLLLHDDKISLDVYHKYLLNRNMITTLDKEINNKTSHIENYNLLNNTNVSIKDDIKHKCDMGENCPYKKFYDMYIQKVKNGNLDNLSRIQETKSEVSILNECKEIVYTLDSIFAFLKTHMSKLTCLPKDVFNIGNFVETYITNRTLYNDLLLVKYIEKIENHNLCSLKNTKLSEVKSKIELYKTNESFIKNITSDIDKVNEEISALNNETDILRKMFDNLCGEISIIDNKISVYESEKLIYEAINELRTEINKIKEDLKEMESSGYDIQLLRNKLSDYRMLDIKLNSDKLEVQKHLRTSEITLNDIISLREEEEIINEKYDFIIEIQKSLSPSKGIPVVFMESYIINMVDYINQLLDSVYEGSLRISKDDIVINDTDFKIPYIKNGTLIKDISNASQGEKSFISLAFSFAMIKMSIGRYNIMLLDEIDTTLDIEKRAKFIHILETYLDSIRAEQVFVISHNNMFDSYPVDLLLTSDINISKDLQIGNCVRLYK